jgi:hypothetical protein
LLVKNWRHANLKVDHGFRHGNISSFKRDPPQEADCRVPSPHAPRFGTGGLGHALVFYPKLGVNFIIFSEMLRFDRMFIVCFCTRNSGFDNFSGEQHLCLRQ